jgi:3-oxoacyl-[acyl-carrier protein] reductase
MKDNRRRVALVTGSATGVGRATAIRFARLGFDVVVNYARSEAEALETVELAKQHGGRVLLHKCDVSSSKAVGEMLRAVETEFGRLDVLVNNAAVTKFIAHHDLDSLTEAVWDEILSVNLKGPYFCIKAAVPLLRQSDAPAVVNVSSVAGMAGEGSSVAYAASKGALNTMTRSLARALAPIRVNSVCPGPIDSRWLKRVMSEEQLQQRVEGYPIPRPAQPDDIADTILYLSTGTSMTTGQCLVVDGGRTM